MVAVTRRSTVGFSPAGQRTQPGGFGFCKYILLVLVACIYIPATLAANDFSASTPATFSIAPVSPEFTAWQAEAGLALAELRDEQGHALGLIPSPLDRSHLLTQTRVPAAQLEGTPSSYDLRTYGYVTPVKNQGGCGSCWAFGSYGPLESWLLKNAAETWDFSENHLKNYHGFDFTPCAGGNADMSTAYLARWSGPVSEADDPYHDYDDRPSPGGVHRKDLERVLWFFTSSDIKNAIMTYGGMYVSMYWNSAYYNPSEYTYCYNGSGGNHAITLIGWDDNKVVTGAPGNGAWLVKNSWGTGWGDNGYFWISYYDSVAVKYAVAFCDAVPTSSYATNYQYDPLGWTTSVGYGTSTAWGANIFIPTANEQLKAVGLYAAAYDTSYIIYVYDSFNGSSFSNLLGSVSGTLSIPGYHTIPLTSPINRTTGNNFSIVVKFTTPDYNYPIPVEMNIPGYSLGATAGPGQSYVSDDGNTFTDITSYSGFAKTNVCIRGLATAIIETRTLTTSSTAGGTVTTPGIGTYTYPYGTDANIVATANANYHFVNWTGTAVTAGKVANPNLASTKVTMDANYTVQANFAIDQRSLTTSTTAGGTVTTPGIGTYWYNHGTDANIVATAIANYHFVNWTGTAVTAGKVSDPNSATTTVLMDANYAVQANFAIDQRSLTTSTTAGGTVTTPGIGTYTYPYGTDANIVATADPNYHFVNWTGTAVTAGKVANPNSASTTVTMDADYTVQANFAESQYTLTVNIAGSGYVVRYPDQPTYHYGDTVYLTAHPAVGWYLSEWSGDASGNEYLKKITMDGNKTITANFAVTQLTISGHVTEPDYITPVEGVAIDATNGGGSDTTDADGYYELTVDYGWSGTVTLQREGYTFDPNGTVYSNVTTDQSKDYIAILDTFIISGHAIDSTLAPLAGVLVTPDNNGGPYTSKYYGGGQDTTDVNGYYEVLVDYNWSGNVVPSKYAYSFEPNSITYANVTQDVEDQNYVGTLLTYRITGYIKEANLVPIAAVLVSADNGGGSDTTDVNGYYEVRVGYGWSGRVIPSKYAYAFQPGSITYANVTQDQQEQNYVGTPSDHRITGYIKNACQVPTAGVYVEANNGGGSDVTDANGSYEVWVGHNYNWSGTVTPSKAHYIFDPNGRAYTNVIEDQTGQDYTANNIYDLDCDGSIGWGDVAVIADNWLLQGPGMPGDFDADEIVNFLDFAEFGNVWQDR